MEHCTQWICTLALHSKILRHNILDIRYELNSINTDVRRSKCITQLCNLKQNKKKEQIRCIYYEYYHYRHHTYTYITLLMATSALIHGDQRAITPRRSHELKKKNVPQISVA